MVGPGGDSVVGSNSDLGLRGDQAQYILRMLNSNLCVVKSLMSLFRILLALNMVSLILDTVGGSVGTALITMGLQLDYLPCITGNTVRCHT